MRRLHALTLLFLASAAAGPAFGQLVLPGALPPSTPSSFGPASGGNGSPAPGQAAPAPKPAIQKSPPEESVFGRSLSLNGASGALTVEKTAAGAQIGHLVLPGFLLSRPAEACRVEVAGGNISLHPAVRHEGLVSYDVELESCPFAIDILDSAALARGKVCDFTAADCRVDPAGVWGPAPSQLSPADDKNIEHMRSESETEARALFRARLEANKQNRSRIKELARDQAGFSSARAEICRDFAGEDKHGFCASRITQARAVALSTQLHGPSAEGGLLSQRRSARPNRVLRPG